MSIRIGYADPDRLLTYPDVNNLSTSSEPIRIRRGRLRYSECEHANFEPIHMRTCQHQQSRQRRQPPPTLTKHSTPKVAGNSPLPISCDEIISLKFRHFQRMIEHSIIELHAKLQGAHRTTVPHSATISTRASPHSNSQRLDTHMELPQHAQVHKTAPASSLLREGRGRGRVWCHASRARLAFS